MLLYFSNVPPNQGGKYSGFGFTKDSVESKAIKQMPTFSIDNAVSSLTTVNKLKKN